MRNVQVGTDADGRVRMTGLVTEEELIALSAVPVPLGASICGIAREEFWHRLSDAGFNDPDDSTLPDVVWRHLPQVMAYSVVVTAIVRQTPKAAEPEFRWVVERLRLHDEREPEWTLWVRSNSLEEVMEELMDFRMHHSNSGYDKMRVTYDPTANITDAEDESD